MTGSLRRRPHTPMRPLWLCRACGMPWPCAVARLSLTEKYADDRTALAIYLWLQLYDAATDLRRLNPHDMPTSQALFNRFLAWATPHPAPD